MNAQTLQGCILAVPRVGVYRVDVYLSMREEKLIFLTLNHNPAV